jgi:lysophospholipase L1-like esterase
VRFWLIVLGLALTVEGATWAQQRIKMGTVHTYVPRHLVDFYRFYRVNPDYRSTTVRVDRAGFRNDEEITIEKPANVVRIVMMGGSTVWGEDGPGPLGVIDNRDTMAAHLEAELNARAVARGSALRFQVINAGVVGYMLFQEETYFSTVIADFKADLVIAMDGHNDLDALQLGLPLYRHRNDGAFDREMNQPLAFDVYREALRYSENKSLFVRKASSAFTGWLNKVALSAWESRFVTPPVEDKIQPWLAAYANTVRRFDASAAIAGTPILFTVQLEVAGERMKPLTPEEQVMHDTRWGYYRWLHTTMRDRLIEQMRAVRDQHGIWFEDVTDTFKNEPRQAYIDYTHLSGMGATTMAKRLATIVEPEVFCDASAAHVTSCGLHRKTQ